MTKKIIFVIIAAAAAWGAWYFFIKTSAAKNPAAGAMGPQMPPPRVIVQLPEVKDIDEFYDFTGNTAAVEEVEIRARVEGFLKTVNFVDGADVKKGQTLFTIEPDVYTARRNQAQAQLQSAQASFERAELDYERIEKAMQTNAVSKQDLTNAKAQRDQARANVAAVTTELETAELNLSYTQITSPIAGRIGRRFVDAGNLVGAKDQTLLATVVRLAPLYVYFNASEDILQEYFMSHRLDELKKDLPKFRIGFAEQDNYPYEGFLDYIDNKVDPMTGTIMVRGQIPNTERQMFPGMFVRIRVPAGVRKDAIVIQQRAVNSDIAGKYVLTVDSNNIVQNNPVKLGQNLGDKVVVESGLGKDQRYIVSGIHSARPGAAVTPAMEDSQGQLPMQAQKDAPMKP